MYFLECLFISAISFKIHDWTDLNHCQTHPSSLGLSVAFLFSSECWRSSCHHRSTSQSASPGTPFQSQYPCPYTRGRSVSGCARRIERSFVEVGAWCGGHGVFVGAVSGACVRVRVESGVAF